MRRRALTTLLLAGLAGCVSTSRVYVPLADNPDPRVTGCVSACGASSLDPVDVYECLRACPGARVSDGKCGPGDVPPVAACLDRRRPNTAGIALIAGVAVTAVVVGVVVANHSSSDTTQPRPGSCPYVYLWDGREYRHYTDLSGSVLGYGIPFFKSAYYGENIYELGTFAPIEGVYRMQLREVIYETSFFDAANLVVVDVPVGYGVFNQWSFTSQLERTPSREFMTVHDPRPPRSARSDRNEDVTAEVSQADGVPLPVEKNQLSRVVVDFGPIAHPEYAKLILTAWGTYQDLRDLQRPPFSAGTTIETLDERGNWQVRRVGGKAAGDSRTWIVDLAGVPRSQDTRMRITMAHLPSVLDVLDAVKLDDSVPVPTRITRVAPRIADLHFGGVAQVEGSTLRHRVLADNGRGPAIPEALLSGWYTRYGDVRPLLQAADDRFVLMANGDELALEFDAPPQAPGTERWVFLSADVFYSTKYHPFGQLTGTNEPLPYHGMEQYPYAPESWPYRDDAAYRKYMSDWNTRRIESPGEGPRQ